MVEVGAVYSIVFDNDGEIWEVRRGYRLIHVNVKLYKRNVCEDGSFSMENNTSRGNDQEVGLLIDFAFNKANDVHSNLNNIVG